MNKSKKKILISVICAVAIVLFLLSLIPAYNYVSTISSNDMDALTEKAFESSGMSFQQYEGNQVLKTVKKGDYLVFLIQNSGYMTDVVFRKNEIFQDRYELCMGGSGQQKGKMSVSTFGDNEMTINVLCGVDLPSQYMKYAFGYRNYQYICPIEDGVVLDVFIDAGGGFTNPYDIQMLE